MSNKLNKPKKVSASDSLFEEFIKAVSEEIDVDDSLRAIFKKAIGATYAKKGKRSSAPKSDRPKRSKSKYQIFMSEHSKEAREELTNEFGDTKTKQDINKLVFSRLATMWKELSEEDQQVYADKAIELKKDSEQSSEEVADEKPVAEKPANKKPAAEKPANKKPTAEKPANKKPTAEKPVDKKPATEKPADKKPTAEKPADKKSVGKGKKSASSDGKSKKKPVEKVVDEKTQDDPETDEDKGGDEGAPEETV